VGAASLPPYGPGGASGYVAHRVDGRVCLTASDIYEQAVLAGQVTPGTSYQ
jgi:hypothetical protein